MKESMYAGVEGGAYQKMSFYEETFSYFKLCRVVATWKIWVNSMFRPDPTWEKKEKKAILYLISFTS